MTPSLVSTSIQDPIEYSLGIFGLIFYYPLNYCLKFIFSKTPKVGAETVVYCAVESELEQSQDLYFECAQYLHLFFFHQTSCTIFFRNCAVNKTSSLAINEEYAEQLWKMSCEVLGL